MVNVQRTGVYAFYLGLCFFASAHTLSAKESKDGSLNSNTSSVNNNVNNRAIVPIAPLEFQWKDHSALSWDDFKGPVTANTDESAAATHCGIGFRTIRSASTGRLSLEVYNTFYVNKSWVRSDAKIASILAHEQGHFDLCELYTRKLRQRLANVDMSATELRSVLEHIYFDVKNEYEERQQAYEEETSHGTIFTQQHRWHDVIVAELGTAAHELNQGLALSSN